jgi:hypothetical protein
MGFWPFGKKEKDDEDEPVEFASRVVTATLGSGALVRGKLVVHFDEPISHLAAERVLASASAGIERAAGAARELGDLSGDVIAGVAAELPDNVVRPRSLELVALHVVDEAVQHAPPSAAERAAAPPSSATPLPARKISSAPPPKPASVPPGPSGSVPPKRSSTPPPADDIEPPPQSSRKPSGQMLIARGMRLVPYGASPEGIGKALVPLVRDATTKLTLGILRAHDLLVVRKIDVDPHDETMAAALVPVTTAPLGFFAESRAEELSRWQTTLGEPSYEALCGEIAAMVAFLFYDALKHAHVEQAVVTTVVEHVSEGAFPEGKSAISKLGHYLHPPEGSAATQLTKGIVRSLGEADELARIQLVLTPLLASLQDDLAVAATQVHSSLAKL